MNKARKLARKLQLFAAVPNTITTQQFNVDPRAIDFVSSFSRDIQALTDIMGIMRPIPKQLGTKLMAKKVTGELAPGDVAEGDYIPLSQFQVTETELGDVVWDKHHDAITIESVAKYGAETAVNRVDEHFKTLIQNNIWAKFYNFLLSGTLASEESTFQMAVAMAIGRVKNAFQNMQLSTGRIAVFVNTLDFYAYLGGAQITMQTAFGRTYIENFLGADIMFIGSDVPQGRVIATPTENIIVYYVDPTGFGESLDLRYMTDSQLPYVGYATRGNYDRAQGENYAISALPIWAEYLDGIAVITLAEAPELASITVTPAEGSTEGTTKATLSGDAGTEGNVLKYKLGAAAIPVEYGENVRNWPVFTESADIAATAGQYITVVEANQYFKAIGSGSAAVVVNDGQ